MTDNYVSPASDAHFRMSKDQLRKLADIGDRKAKSEIQRRAANRRARKQS